MNSAGERPTSRDKKKEPQELHAESYLLWHSWFFSLDTS
jgi:hypothetical protein